MSQRFTLIAAVAAAVTLAACGAMPASGTHMAPPLFSQDGLPDAVKVPAGHRVAAAGRPPACEPASRAP